MSIFEPFINCGPTHTIHCVERHHERYLDVCTLDQPFAGKSQDVNTFDDGKGVYVIDWNPDVDLEVDGEVDVKDETEDEDINGWVSFASTT